MSLNKITQSADYDMVVQFIKLETLIILQCQNHY